MCTITYLPFSERSDSFVLTNNRDEAISRPADFPQQYREYETQLYYPKDRLAGGTWIGLSERAQLIALMNGAFEKHQRLKNYRKSRGVVVKELLAAKNMIDFFVNCDFTGIEAFFAVAVSWKKELMLYELIWDGHRSFVREKNPEEPVIWSSAMLYAEEQHFKRIRRFQDFIKNSVAEVNARDIWDFHQQKGNKNEEGLIIDRGFLKTTSTSQFIRFGDEQLFRYKELASGREQTTRITWSH